MYNLVDVLEKTKISKNKVIEILEERQYFGALTELKRYYSEGVECDNINNCYSVNDKRPLKTIKNRNDFLNYIEREDEYRLLSEVELKFVYFDDFTLNEKHEVLLKQFFESCKSSFKFDVNYISTDNRDYIFKFLVANNYSNLIPFGLNQDHDIKKIKAGDEIDYNLDFVNWDDFSKYDIFNDDEYKNVLFYHIADMIEQNDFRYDNNFVLLELLKNYDGIKLLNNYNCTNNLMEFIIKHKSTLLSKLKEFQPDDNEITYKLMTFQNMDWQLLDYLNTNAIVKYITEENKQIEKLEKNENYTTNIKYAIYNYKKYISKVESDKFKEHFLNDRYFTMTPLLYTFNDFLIRYKNTGDLNVSLLISAVVEKHQENDFYEFFMNVMNDDIVNKIIDEDKNLVYSVFSNKNLKESKMIDILNKFPELIVYYI